MFKTSFVSSDNSFPSLNQFNLHGGLQFDEQWRGNVKIVSSSMVSNWTTLSFLVIVVFLNPSSRKWIILVHYFISHIYHKFFTRVYQIEAMILTLFWFKTDIHFTNPFNILISCRVQMNFPPLSVNYFYGYFTFLTIYWSNFCYRIV